MTTCDKRTNVLYIHLEERERNIVWKRKTDEKGWVKKQSCMTHFKVTSGVTCRNYGKP